MHDGSFMRRGGFTRVAVVIVTMLLTLAAIPATPASAATTYYVGTAGDSTAAVSDCATSSNTDCTLRDALAVATSGGDTVLFGSGFPSGTQTINIAARGTLAVSHTVTLTGPLNQTVVIDGGYDPVGHTGGVRIFDVTGTTTFTIRNLTVQHGSALGGTTASGSGGGILVASDSTLVATHCAFTANATNFNGGAIFGASIVASGTGSTISVVDSTFAGNSVLAGATNTGGGAIAVLNRLLTVTNSIFTNNTAPGDNNSNFPGGGAIFIDEPLSANPGTSTIDGGSFSNNSAALGGAVWDDLSLLTVTNATFTGNSANGGASSPSGINARGGAIFQGGGTLTVTGGSFMTNSAALNGTNPSVGGAVALYPGFNCFCTNNAVGVVTGATFKNNNASNGGAIGLIYLSTLSVGQSTFDTNTASWGGAIFQEKASTTIVGGTFTGNGGANATIGGAFSSLNTTGQTSTATIIDSTFTGNIAGAGEGGGILSDNATTTTIINSTLYANTALNGLGGDVYHYHACCNAPTAGGTVTLVNTLVGGSAATGGDLVTDAATPSAVFLGHNNLIDNAASAGPFTNGTANNKVGVPAGVGSLGSNGGPTQTIPLLAGSAAIGAGDTSVCAAAPPNGAGGVDQRGLPRPAGACSIGAFEPQPVPNPLPQPKPAGPNQGGPPAPLPVPPRPSGPTNIGSPAPLPSRRP